MIDKQKAFDAWAKPFDVAFMPSSAEAAIEATYEFEQRLKHIASTFNLDDKTVMHIRDNAAKVCVSTVYNRPDVLNRIEGVLNVLDGTLPQDAMHGVITVTMNEMFNPAAKALTR